MAPSSRSGRGDGRAHGRTEPGRWYQVPRRTTRRRAAAAPRGLGIPLRRCPDTFASACSLVAARSLAVALQRTGQAAVVRSDRAVHDRRPRAGRLPGSRGAASRRAIRDAAPRRSTRGGTARPTNLGSLADARASTRSASPAGPGRSVPSGRPSWPSSATHGPRRRRARRLLRPERRRPRRGRRSSTESAPMHRGPAGSPARHDDRRAHPDRGRSGPAAEPDVVNVVITNDLPDARIQDAIDAFGGR